MVRLALALAVVLASLVASGRVPDAAAAIDPAEIVTLLPRDAIPAILDPAPLFVAASAMRSLPDGARVLGVAVGAEAHAYPITFLSWHEIVNDVVGGQPIAATW